MIATRVQRALVTQGVMTETGLTRKARTHHCRRCHVPALACIDANGMDAWTWPDPTTVLGELLAWASGLRTWHRAISGDGLIVRDAHVIAAKPADVVDVHVQHVCGHTPPPVKACARSWIPPTYLEPPF